jgi:amino acid adenylation domain-containing protein
MTAPPGVRGPEPAGAPEDLLERFAAQAARRPDHPAVEAHEGTFSYRRFDRVSDVLAARLRENGVGRDARVAVALPRGAREIAALLATLKTGACYVPIDPSHPIERIRGVLEDADPQVLITLTDSPLLRTMPATTRPLHLDELPSADEAAAFVREPVGDGSLAYILFTSGTTGRPKGVEIPRAALANFLRSMEREPGMKSADRLLAITTTTFDIAGLELFLPLWSGATVVIADRETACNPRRLRERLEQGSVSVMQATPATWRLLLDAGWRGDGRLRMLCGGEPMSAPLAERLLQAGGELWNVYGPTETTIWSTLEKIEKGRPITIGRPIDHTQVYLLDEQLRPVSRGEVGELCIAGRGLARGYRGRPDLTAARFVPDPHGPPGSRLHRTGDLGRLLEDGRLECLGRMDHQVKIRGFRIELGEIESVLQRVEGVRDSVVMARAREGEDPMLCAYWVGSAPRDALLQAVRARLPAYMVPTAYVNLAEFPLNSNGKVDRKALPPPESGPAIAPPGVGPRNRAEERMASIWSDVLGVASVSVDQDFFALGGTSIHAIEICARIFRSFGVELPLRSFFETPTIERLVGRLGESDTSADPIVLTLGNGPAAAPPLHCLLGIALFQDVGRSFSGRRTVFGIHAPIRTLPGGEVPGVAEIAARYVEAIRRRQPHGPYHVAGLCFGGIVAYEAARQLEATGERVATVTVIDGHLPGAEQISWGRRLAQLSGRMVRDPGGVLTRFRGGRPGKAAGDGQTKPVELALEGPQEHEATRVFERGAWGLRAHLLVFRARQRNEDPWLRIREDFGWKGRAVRLSLFDVDAGHLEIVRPPHVAEVTRVLAAAMAEAEGK